MPAANRFASVALALVCVAGAAHAGTPTGFVVNDFSSSSDITWVGAAAPVGASAALTTSTNRVAGGVWSAARHNVVTGFQTSFDLQVISKAGAGADGFAFVIQNVGNNVLGGTGGALGYADNSYYGQPGIANSLAIEFDLWNNNINNDWADFNSAAHVSVQSRSSLANSASSDDSLGWSPLAMDLEDAGTHTVTIEYFPGTLSIYVDDLVTPVLTTALNLGALVSLDGGSHTFVGLTSATGGAQDAQTHMISNWTFTPGIIPAPGAISFLAGFGIAAARRSRRA